jgi:hypothetical protein
MYCISHTLSVVQFLFTILHLILRSVHNSFISFIHSSMALQPFVGPWPLFSFVIFFTQTVVLLGRVNSPSQGRYLHTGQHKHRHPSLEWDWNPRSQRSSEHTPVLYSIVTIPWSIVGLAWRWRSTPVYERCLVGISTMAQASWGFSWFSSVIPGKFWNMISTASFEVLSNSFFI